MKKILIILIFTPAIFCQDGYQNCSSYNLFGPKKLCSLCLNSIPNPEEPGCLPMPKAYNCELAAMQGEDKQIRCLLCKPGYGRISESLDISKSCEKLPSVKENCAYSVFEGSAKEQKCEVCLQRFVPDGAGCKPAAILENCVLYSNSSFGPKCFRCKKGYANLVSGSRCSPEHFGGCWIVGRGDVRLVMFFLGII